MYSVVMDNGSLFSRVGFATSDIDMGEPTNVFQSLVADVNKPPRKRVVGPGAENMRRTHNYPVRYAVQGGFVANWGDMESIWHNSFVSCLRVEPEECEVLLTEPVGSPAWIREGMGQILFESFSVPAMLVHNQAALASYSYGKTTGTVLELGDGISQVVSFQDGQVVPGSIMSLSVAGSDMTQALMDSLSHKGIRIQHMTKDMMRKIKESICYVALDYRQEWQAATTLPQCETKYELPDGNEITLREERIACAEVLFTSSGDGIGGLHERVAYSANQADPYLRQELYRNILVSGGVSSCPRLADRLNKELSNMLGPFANICTTISPKGDNTVWCGGSLLASLSTAPWISKQEYAEWGACIMHRPL